MDKPSVHHIHDGPWCRQTIWTMHARQKPVRYPSSGWFHGLFHVRQNRYINLHDMGRPQGFTTKGLYSIMSSGVPGKQLGAALRIAMGKVALDRLLPRVLWAAGLSGDTKIEDPWEKFDWRRFRGQGKRMPADNGYRVEWSSANNEVSGGTP